MKFPAALLLALGTLSACSSGSGDDPRTDAADRDASAGDERASAPAGLGCGWQAMSDIDTSNIAYPDQAATYWVALVPNLPGTRLRIDGRYPAARYFSYNVYDPAIRPVDAIADYEVQPQQAGSNPYVTQLAAAGAPYTAYVEFSAAPEQRAANTVYAGATDLGGQSLPNAALTPLIYRIYVPRGARLDGDVGLPVLTLETADGERELLPYADCDSPLLPDLGGALPDPGLNELLLGVNYPEQLGIARFPTASFPPKTTVFYGLPDTLLRILNNVSPTALPEPLQSTEIGSGGGFLSNQHNAYTSTAFSRNDGAIFLLRAKAPTWRDQPGVAFGSEELRYWSVCQNEFASQRYVACSADSQTVLDAQGYFTIVVSDAADRPANATAEQHISWLPWGPYPDGLLLYRHMLPAPGYAATMSNVPQGTDPQAVMGEYFPQAAYCSRASFEATAGDAAAVFQACQAETQRRAEDARYLVPVP